MKTAANKGGWHGECLQNAQSHLFLGYIVFLLYCLPICCLLAGVFFFFGYAPVELSSLLLYLVSEAKITFFSLGKVALLMFPTLLFLSFLRPCEKIYAVLCAPPFPDHGGNKAGTETGPVGVVRVK